MGDGVTHLVELLEAQLKVVLVVFEAALLLEHLLSRLGNGHIQAGQPLGFLDQLQYPAVV